MTGQPVGKHGNHVEPFPGCRTCDAGRSLSRSRRHRHSLRYRCPRCGNGVVYAFIALLTAAIYLPGAVALGYWPW